MTLCTFLTLIFPEQVSLLQIFFQTRVKNFPRQAPPRLHILYILPPLGVLPNISYRLLASILSNFCDEGVLKPSEHGTDPNGSARIKFFGLMSEEIYITLLSSKRLLLDPCHLIFRFMVTAFVCTVPV